MKPVSLDHIYKAIDASRLALFVIFSVAADMAVALPANVCEGEMDIYRTERAYREFGHPVQARPWTGRARKCAIWGPTRLP
jgi:hypothetical protein